MPQTAYSPEALHCSSCTPAMWAHPTVALQVELLLSDLPGALALLEEAGDVGTVPSSLCLIIMTTPPPMER